MFLFSLFLFSSPVFFSNPAFADAVKLPWNSTKQEFGASLSAKGNLFFYSNRGGHGTDLFESRRVNGSFAPPEPLTELNSPHDDQSPCILPDESGIIFSSNRDGSHEFETDRGIAVSRDLYFAEKTQDGFSAPVRLPDTINTNMIEENPFLYGKRLFLVRYPFGQPRLARIYYSDFTASGWSEAREAFPFTAITPGISAGRFYFSRTSEKGDYQISYVALGDGLLPDLKQRLVVRNDLDTASDEASYAASPDNSIVVFCRRSAAGDYDLFELRAEPWEETDRFSLRGIVFGPGSSKVLPSSDALLDRLAAYLKAHPRKLLVTGHADKTGSEAENVRLSLERADAVKSALIARGVPAELMRTEGKGTREPVDSRDTPEALALNRRTEFRFDPPAP